ncbi:hypothetical protein A361_05715 [Cytobacillus oceanisediminis 2691]|uniref:Uncharacterized protein n=1 Tax=Cytobacillus oceanisediminis 2691 TaxID=1196031 RepID=A0A160M7Z7_9BACI|nr:hypothetical protein A361_05715 [Cytobacillus oceanisediminis 2691]
MSELAVKFGQQKSWFGPRVSLSSDKKKRENLEFCPKPLHVRTGEEEISWTESEVALCSDRKRGEIVNCVRSCPMFGQEKRKNRGLSPKSLYVRIEKEGKS